ncbi:MAG: MFS transporter [Acidobacteria bacterium]|nr:MFS transporter [Acidobacteriota bacterium]
MLQRNLLIIYAAACLRSIGVGLTGVILGIYLSRAGLSAITIGIVIAVGLAGVALATLAVSFRADWLGRRCTLVGLSLLAASGGFGLALFSNLPAVLLVAFLGMLNGMGRDRGAAFALEQAIIPEATAAGRRTWALAWYNLILDAGHALGALASAVPFLFRQLLGVDLLASYRMTFGLYGALGLLSAALYALLSSQVEVRSSCTLRENLRAKISPRSKRIVAKLASLSALDSAGGGVLTSALLAYWFFQRFGVAEETLGPLFFFVRLANAGSYLAAAWLARRIGLLNTMVFTHIPSSLFLMAVAFAPSFAWAVILFLARECLVEMDVPTRQSYIVAVVRPHERTFASGVTNVTRSIAWAAGSSIAGCFMQYMALAAPLFVGGSMKITYDILLYFAFRQLNPSEEDTEEQR